MENDRAIHQIAPANIYLSAALNVIRSSLDSQRMLGNVRWSWRWNFHTVSIVEFVWAW